MQNALLIPSQNMMDGSPFFFSLFFYLVLIGLNCRPFVRGE